MRSATRIEIALLLLAVAAGGWLRGRELFTIGLSHHDEGVYAITSMAPVGNFGELVDLLVSQGLYSPPAFPLLARVTSNLLGGPTEYGVLATSWLFSVLSIAAAWLIGRRWRGAAVGLLAAWLFALDGMQIAFARTGLTDPTFTFGFLVATALAVEAVRSERWDWRIVAAGLACGFTWNIKYNGFLPVVLAAGFIPGVGAAGRTVKLAVVGAIALACYLPWAATFHVKHDGGYLAMVEHHRGYYLGPKAVASAGRAAFENHMAMPTAAMGAAVAVWFGICRRTWRSILAGVGLAALFASDWMLPAAIALALLGVASLRSAQPSPGMLFGGLWSAAVLAVLPALYTSYLRLWLPTDAWGLIAAAVGADVFRNWIDRDPDRLDPERGFGRYLDWTAATIAVVGIAALAASDRRPWNPIPPTPTGYAAAARSIQNVIEESGPSRVHAYVRPPLRLYLSMRGIGANYLAEPQPPTAAAAPPGEILIFDHSLVHGREPSIFQGWEELAAFDFQPSVVTALDDFPGYPDEFLDAYRISVWRRR